MTPAEAAALLGIAAGFDNRKVDETGETAKLWARALEDVSWADATEALAGHFRESTEYLMPAHIVARVKRIRAKRLEEAPPLIPPAELDGDPVKTIAWLRVWRRRIADGDPAPAYGELRARNMPDLLAITSRVDNEQEAS